MKTLIARLRYEVEEYWRSDKSTIHGVVAAAFGLVAHEAGRHALRQIGIPAAVVDYAGAVALIVGAVLITPAKTHDD